MDHDFWHERWTKNTIAFHQGRVNAGLERHLDALHLDPGATVLVPLCGKAVDMRWLRERGFNVVGIDISPIALRDFFTDNDEAYEERTVDQFSVFEGTAIRLFCGDFFALDSNLAGSVDAVYDRAALVALPQSMRARYAEHLLSVVPDAAPALVVTFEYAQAEMDGPPFSVGEDEVRRLFEPAREVHLVSTEDVLADATALRGRGLSALSENVFVLRPHG